MAVTGLLLSAGAGRRMGGPKGLLRDPDGTPWVARVVWTLRSGGCTRVLVVVGAAAGEVRALLPEGVEVVTAQDWAQGMGASLRAGLDALARDGAGGGDAVLVTLVDLPGVTAEVVARVAARAAASVLARAAFAGVPGHPVLIGREHWAGVAAAAGGDAGARAYLAAHADQVELVECGDVGSGQDVDTPADLRRPAAAPGPPEA